MSDETRPNHPVDDEPEDDKAQDQRRPPSRLDRLMRAKDKADKEAARWSEIEDLGTPVPSHDQPGQDVTQPFPVEPPRQVGDTPVGEDTPSQPLPPVSPTPAQPPSPPSQRPAPPFPHPTDQPLPPPGAPPPHPTDRGFQPTPPPVPPPPAQTDEYDTRRGVKPPGGQPHQRYQPPPEDIEQVRLDSNGMPLPRHVPREDADATLVGASAYSDDAVPPLAPPTQPHGYAQPEWPAAQPPTRGRAVSPLPPSRAALSRRAARPRVRGLRFSWGCLARAMMLALVFGLVSAMLGAGAAAIYYAQVTAPSFAGINQIGDLQARALQFQTTRIRDSEGNILYELNDPHGGFRDYVTLDEVSPWVIVATVATEERNYFTNPGFSIPAIVRAVIRNFQEGRTVSGASTITQQLTRALLLPEERRTERSYRRKIDEIFLAAELGRRFTKREILELYLNQIYYGNLAYGIEAAAQTYFGKSARDLTLAEASFLAGLPQAPAIYDPVTNREAVIQRQQSVLQLMLEAQCIDTGDSGLDLSAYCVTDAQIAAAQPDLAAIASREFHAPALQARYPHWVVYVQHLLESDPTIGPAIYTSGFDVYTTLNPRLQDLAQQNVDLTLSGLTDRNVNNASVVIIDPHSGAILAMVGSKDFNDTAIDGQVNIALTPQQPGSSIKPFTYLAAFRKGWTPSTVIWDVPISYDIPGFGVYAPDNYDGRFHGPVPVRTALANSYNDPAVQTLDFVGVPALLQVLNDVGITSLGDPSNPNNYGLSLTLGAGDVYLLEWANAYATLANGGKWHPTYAIDRIERNGQVIEGYPYQVPEGKQVLEPDLVYLLTTILSDKEARIPAFGANTPISPPYPAAAKTGTTNDFRDNWTMGFTTELAVGVWVGNTDNSPMNNVSGVTGAGPIWRGIMDGSQQWYPAQPFTRPSGIFDQTVCSDDGALPSPYCTEHSQVRTDVFATRMPPPAADQGLYRQLKVDQFTGLIANENCPDFTEDRFFVVLPNPSQLIDLRTFERDWLLNTDDGRAWATQRVIPPDRFEDPPTEACKPDTPKPTIVIDSPQQGSEQIGVVTIIGTVDAPNFSHYTVEFGVGDNPQAWGILQADTFQSVHNGQLGQADLSAYGSGVITIRVTVYDSQGHHAERHVAFMFVQPTPTPAPTAMPTPTEIPMPTLPPATQTPSETPTETPTVTPTPG